MPLASGTRFGFYEILAPIGAGGMGSACGRGERAHAGRAAARGGGAPRALEKVRGVVGCR